MLYRILRKIDCGERGVLGPEIGIHKLGWMNAKAINKLIEVGAISRVKAPPMEALPGLGKESKKLSTQGILDAGEVLEMEEGELAKKLKITKKQARQVKGKVKGFLEPDKPKKSG